MKRKYKRLFLVGFRLSTILFFIALISGCSTTESRNLRRELISRNLRREEVRRKKQKIYEETKRREQKAYEEAIKDQSEKTAAKYMSDLKTIHRLNIEMLDLVKEANDNIENNYDTPDKAFMLLGVPRDKIEGDSVLVLDFSNERCVCKTVLTYDKETKKLIKAVVNSCQTHHSQPAFFGFTDTDWGRYRTTLSQERSLLLELEQNKKVLQELGINAIEIDREKQNSLRAVTQDIRKERGQELRRLR